VTFEDFLRDNKAANGYVLHTWVLPNEVRFFITSSDGKTEKFVAREGKVDVAP